MKSNAATAARQNIVKKKNAQGLNVQSPSFPLPPIGEERHEAAPLSRLVSLAVTSTLTWQPDLSVSDMFCTSDVSATGSHALYWALLSNWGVTQSSVVKQSSRTCRMQKRFHEGQYSMQDQGSFSIVFDTQHEAKIVVPLCRTHLRQHLSLVSKGPPSHSAAWHAAATTVLNTT